MFLLLTSYNFMDQYLNMDGVQKKRFSNAVLAAVVLLALFLGVKVLSEIKEFGYIGGGVYPANTITVNGTGEVFAIPDTGEFSFSVVEEGATVKLAQDKATKKMNDILAAIKSLGIEEKDVKTIGYTSYPKYEYRTMACAQGYCPPGKSVLTGYEVSHTISVKVRKTDKAGEALTLVGTLGASNISGLNFVTDDIEKVRAEARDKAIKDAKEKAQELSKSLGVKLVKIVSFYENGENPTPMYHGGMESKTMVMDVAQIAPQLPVGENEVVSNVSITYEVR